MPHAHPNPPKWEGERGIKKNAIPNGVAFFKVVVA